MSDEEWDADGFQPTINIAKTDKWDGEDEDDSVKDNWDDDEDEEEKEAKPVVVVKKKKKTLEKKIAEKEEAKQLELKDKLERQRLEDEMHDPDKAQEQRERVHKIQQQADLELALEAFGLTDSDTKKLGPIELSAPITKDDFAKFSQLIYDKVITYKDSKFFIPFLENVFRDLTLGVEPESIKKISTSLTALYSEKLKVSKLQKNKKSKKAVVDKTEKNEFADFADYM